MSRKVSVSISAAHMADLSLIADNLIIVDFGIGVKPIIWIPLIGYAPIRKPIVPNDAAGDLSCVPWRR
jgi:hypothetical protein